MTIKQFIEKAIEGGWVTLSTQEFYRLKSVGIRGGSLDVALSCVFLDPLAWQAVGKVEGWSLEEEMCTQLHSDAYLCKMHDMIDALAEGKTIEQFLETL